MTEEQLKKEQIDFEMRIAKKCEQLLTQSLRGKIGGINLHLSRNAKSMANAEAVSNFTRARKKGYDAQKGFTMLSILMQKQGFIHNYGVSRIREATPKTSYLRSHPFNLPRKPFIKDAVTSSGVLQYAITEMGRSNANYTLKNIKYILENYKE